MIRFGGEEFCIILPGINSNRAVEILNRLNKFIGKLTIKGKYKIFYSKLTISAGIAQFPDIPAKNLMHAADIALYIAKNQGRDCSIVFSKKILDNFNKNINS